MVQPSYRYVAKRHVPTSVSALALVAAISSPAFSQTQTAQAQPATGALDEIVVTGSRIVRDGYEAPTPVSVLGAAELNAMAATNISDAVNRLPALSGSLTTRNSSGADMTGGIQNLNLRGLSPNRTLVLIDGKRVVGGTLAGFDNNGSAVDVNTVPNGLVSRVDIVTGGASAAYGSDALAGVVNFVFDKEFTGVKGEINGGITTRGDGENYKVDLTVGVPFGGGRGHLLAFGEHTYDHGIPDTDRGWNQPSFSIIPNPGYAAGNGLPQYIMAENTGLATATPGGLILQCPGYATNACPLRGTMFGAGGSTAPFRFAPNYVSGTLMSGGDWEISRIDYHPTLATRLTRANAYVRLSYDLADNVNMFAEWGYSYTFNDSLGSVPQFHLGNITVRQDNAFIPTSVRNQMVALNISQFTLGTTNIDMPKFGNNNERIQRRYVAGAEGAFDAMDTSWTWDAYYQKSTTHASVRTPGDEISANYTKANDAVVNPANGQIVCRVNVDAIATNDDPLCKPYNVMGIGVNSADAINYITGTGYSLIYLQQDVIAASATGEPLSSWAGPVSLALGAEHRIEQVRSFASAIDEARGFFAGNFTGTTGKYTVTEGFVETVVPLAKDTSWATSLDINGAVRATSYSTSGYVTTWKIGATYKPVEDITFRATRSRDIRAPNLGDLFSAGRSGTGAVIDPATNVSSTVVTRVEGNPALLPEKANTTGLGVVYQPGWLPGFGASVDYYNIDIAGAIVSLSAQQYVDRCYTGVTQLCSFIQRDAAGVINFVRVLPANVLSQGARGIDFEVSYRFPLADIVDDWDGQMSLRALATYTDRLRTVDGTNTVQGAGVNADGGGGLAATNGLFAPHLKYIISAGYSADRFSSTLTMRGIGKGVYNNAFVQCTSGCPASTPFAPTVALNSVPAIAYFDLALNYKIMEGDTAELFLVTENVFDKDPPRIAAGTGGGYWSGQSNGRHYDRIGRNFRAGVRFKM
ncbi:MAG: TonB-dependent receptor [Rhodospirillaceae bacterium]|nr:TonB-dependent receptor [Rhodospirillaceae bacterium]